MYWFFLLTSDIFPRIHNDLAETIAEFDIETEIYNMLYSMYLVHDT